MRRRLYIYIYIYIIFYIVRPTVLAPGWSRATRKRSRPDHTCKYVFLHVYICIRMYSNKERLQRGYRNAKRGYGSAKKARFRQQRLRKLSLRQRSRSPLSESQQRRDYRLSRRRERERKRRLRKQQRNERYAWGGVGRKTELGGLLRLWRPNQRKERLA